MLCQQENYGICQICAAVFIIIITTGALSFQRVVFSTNPDICVTWSYDHVLFTTWCPSVCRETGVYNLKYSKIIITKYMRSIQEVFNTQESVTDTRPKYGKQQQLDNFFQYKAQTHNTTAQKNHGHVYPDGTKIIR